jgi:hypothetical protein
MATKAQPLPSISSVDYFRLRTTEGPTRNDYTFSLWAAAPEYEAPESANYGPSIAYENGPEGAVSVTVKQLSYVWIFRSVQQSGAEKP